MLLVKGRTAQCNTAHGRRALNTHITCPKYKGAMTFQGVQSIGAGAARIPNIEVYICPKCAYDEQLLKIVEIR